MDIKDLLLRIFRAHMYISKINEERMFQWKLDMKSDIESGRPPRRPPNTLRLVGCFGWVPDLRKKV